MLDFEVLVTTLMLVLAAGLGVALWVCRRLRNTLESVEGRLDVLSERLRPLGSSHVDADAGPVGPPSPRAARRVDRGAPEPSAGPTLIAVPNLAVTVGPAASPDVSAELGRRFATVWDRAGQGVDAKAIARETGQPVGQVELILGLRRQAVAVGPATHSMPRDDGGRPRP